jgi:hypothetical protein
MIANAPGGWSHTALHAVGASVRCSRALDVTIQREQFPKSKDPLIIWAGPIIARVTLARYSGQAPVEEIEKYVADGGYVIVMVKRVGVPQHAAAYYQRVK